jgi:hypothetical protein
MDWKEQAEQMVKTWSEAQKQMWDNWMEIQKGSAQFQSKDLWEKTVETCEEMVKKSLEAQSEWVKVWAENTPSLTGVPREVAEWAAQARDMNKRWLDVQQQLWAGWFDLIKKTDPGKVGGSWDQDSQKMARAWQESIDKIMQAQLEWTRLWTGEKKGEESTSERV